MMASGYDVLAWNSRSVQTGTLVEQDLEIKVVLDDLPLEDIRNCSSAHEQPWGAVTGVNRQTSRQELWRFDLDGTRAEPLVAADYILHNAVDPTGRYVCYTAPPSKRGEDMSLYLYDLQTSRCDLIVEATVSRACIPSWRCSTGKVVYHTFDRQVAQVDINTRDADLLFSGEYPAVSLDGLWVAYREGNKLRLWNAVDQHVRDVSRKRWFWEGQLRGGMSWSPDGELLIVGRSAGVFGYEMLFQRVEIRTGKRLRVRERHLQGLRFR